MFGRWGREFLGIAQLLFLVFIMGSHILTFSVMMNTLTDHGTCSIVFGIVGLVVSFICALPRTLTKMSWLSIACEDPPWQFFRTLLLIWIAAFISIFSAVMVTMIGVGIERPGDGHVDATVKTNLYHGFLAVTNIVFAFCKHQRSFSFCNFDGQYG